MLTDAMGTTDRSVEMLDLREPGSALLQKRKRELRLMQSERNVRLLRGNEHYQSTVAGYYSGLGRLWSTPPLRPFPDLNSLSPIV